MRRSPPEPGFGSPLLNLNFETFNGQFTGNHHIFSRVNLTDTDSQINAKIEEIHATFDIAEAGRDKISMPVTDEALRWSARVAVGLDKLVADFDLQGLTYYYRGLDANPNEELGASLIVGNSLLTAAGFPMCGESDLKTCIAMLIMDRLDIGGKLADPRALVNGARPGAAGASIAPSRYAAGAASAAAHGGTTSRLPRRTHSASVAGARSQTSARRTSRSSGSTSKTGSAKSRRRASLVRKRVPEAVTSPAGPST